MENMQNSTSEISKENTIAGVLLINEVEQKEKELDNNLSSSDNLKEAKQIENCAGQQNSSDDKKDDDNYKNQQLQKEEKQDYKNSEEQIKEDSKTEFNSHNNDGDDEMNATNQSCYNPTLSDDLKDEDLEKKMKGDAIGNTLYSERFVLSTLLKLTKIIDEEQKETILDNDEEFEKDLCNLWDMTIEKDVVKLLLEHKVLELFTLIIQKTDDKRLIEILIGIIANMCNINETRDELCMNNDIIQPIIDLISCTDTLTLIQLMRLFHTALIFENSGDELIWFQHFKNSKNFIENFSYILCNSINSILLINSLEALNSILAKFSVMDLQQTTTTTSAPSTTAAAAATTTTDNDITFCDYFVKPSLIMGVNEAFRTLLPNSIAQSLKKSNESQLNNSELDNSDTTIDNTTNLSNNIDVNCDLPSQNTQKIMNLFLDIHVILSQYGIISKKSYETFKLDLMKCITRILSPLCQPICLLPLTFNEQGIIENVNELFQALDDPFDEICFAQMITIWNLIDTHYSELKDEQTTGKSATTTNNSLWDDDVDVDNRTITSSTVAKTNSKSNDFNDFDDEVNSEDICMTILEYLTRTIRNASEEQLKNSLHLHSPRTIMKLLSALSAGDSEPDIQECCIKIKTIFDKLNDEENQQQTNHHDNCVDTKTTEAINNIHQENTVVNDEDS